jgi:hypothetical protein
MPNTYKHLSTKCLIEHPGHNFMSGIVDFHTIPKLSTISQRVFISMITFPFEHSPPLLMAMSFIWLTDLKMFWTHWALSTAMNSEESSTLLLVHLFCHKSTGPTFTKQISMTHFMWTMFWRSRVVLLRITRYYQQTVARSHRPIACIRTRQSPAHTEG